MGYGRSRQGANDVDLSTKRPLPAMACTNSSHWGRPQDPNSVGALAFQHRRDRLQDDVEVERQRPVLDVEGVEADRLGRRDVAAAVDLPPAGHAGLDLVAGPEQLEV